MQRARKNPEKHRRVFSGSFVTIDMTQSPRFSRALSFALVGLFLTALSRAVAADATPRMFDLPSDTAEHALKQFSEQTKLEVLIGTKVGREVKTNAVKGEMSPRAALDAMLAGTGLVIFQDEKSGALVVRRENADESKNVNRAIAESSDRPARARRVTQNDDGEDVLKLDTFEVFERKTLNMDIRRTENDVQPYVVFDSSTIANSNAVSVEDFLRTRLPMNTQSNSAGFKALPNNNAQGNINLRGLGADQTLILVDGRRISGVTVSGDLLQPNINGIPKGAVERIEVLPATAGGIYGGSATGGVINIILKRNYSGLTFTAGYGNTLDTDVAYRTLSANIGFSFNNERTRVQVNYAASTNGELRASDRDFDLKSGQALLSNNPLSTFIQSRYGSRPNIINTTNTPLVFRAQYGGVPLNSSRTAIPAGYSGLSSDAGSTLLSQAGKLNLDNGTSVLYKAPDLHSYNIDVRHEISRIVDVFVDYSHQGTTQMVHLPVGVRVNFTAADPLNPFGQAIRVNVPIPNLSTDWGNSLQTNSLRIGAIAKLTDGWNVSLEFERSRFSSDSKQTSAQFLGANLTTLKSYVFQDLTKFPIPNAGSLMSPNVTTSAYNSVLLDAALRAGGPIYRFSAGEVTLSGLFEARSEKSGDNFLQSDFNGTTTINWNPPSSQKVNSGYIEVVAPILGTSGGAAPRRILEMSAAVRADGYTSSWSDSTVVPSRQGPFPTLPASRGDFSASSNTAGLKFSPIDEAFLRISYATGFLPPGLPRLLVTSIPNITFENFYPGVTDPRRGDSQISGTGTLVTGGNTGLRPEKSKSTSIGIVVIPKLISGLRCSVDLVEIKKTNEIASPPPQYILNNEASFPGRVVRGTNVPGDLPGWAGPITLFDTSLLNLASTKMSAIDYNLEYSRSLGGVQYHFYAAATYEWRLSKKVLSSDPDINSVGLQDGPLRWRGNLGVDLQLGKWSAGWNAQYYDYQYVYASTDTASQRASAILDQGASKVPSQLYHDIYVKYRLSGEKRWFGDLDVSLSVQNAFNTQPPILARLGLSPFADPRLRRFVISVEKHFDLR